MTNYNDLEDKAAELDLIIIPLKYVVGAVQLFDKETSKWLYTGSLTDCRLYMRAYEDGIKKGKKHA